MRNEKKVPVTYSTGTVYYTEAELARLQKRNVAKLMKKFPKGTEKPKSWPDWL